MSSSEVPAIEYQYPIPFAASPLFPLLYLSLITQRFTPKISDEFLEEYDYIVVGSGSGGATVASRLSEESCVSVLLLEAGKSPPAMTEVPIIPRSFVMSDLDWNDVTTPQRFTGRAMNGRILTFPGGKAVGGSTIINAMLYTRGSRQIYDQWEAQGATGWSYKDVLPYFKKSEMNRNPEDIEVDFHGFDGPMTVETPKFDDPYKTAFEAAVPELGYTVIDVNGQNSKGFYNYQGNLRNGQRCSVAKAYLVPAENRTNLHILNNAMVTKVLISNRRAEGVQFDRSGETYTVKARREVILSAGTVRSAQLLMLSGIGPREHLMRMGIPVIADLPVGNNFQDHITGINPFYSNTQTPAASKVTNDSYLSEYIENRSGYFASCEGVMYMGFLTNRRQTPPDAIPDYEIYILDGNDLLVRDQLNFNRQIYDQYYGPHSNVSQLWCCPQITRPKSVGTIRLKSTNPYDPPIIDPNYLSNPSDLNDMLQGMKECDRIGMSASYRALGVRPFERRFPGCEMFPRFSDAYHICTLRGYTFSLSHQVGTAKMGNPSDPTTVVDPQLRVKTIQGLRVADASIMPLVPTANTNNPTIMVGEKAADLIKEDIRCSNPTGAE